MKTDVELYKEMSDMHHDLLVVMQAAYIEWQHGDGAESAMQWIANTLAGPGLIPNENEPYGTETQAYWDANNSHPLPKCFCGRPSNMGGNQEWYCSEEHYEQGKNDAKKL